MARIIPLVREQEFTEMTCGECGIVFAIETWLREKWINGKHSFYCPNGHLRQFIGESAAERIKRELTAKLESAQRDAEWWRVKNTENDKRLSAAKGQMTKLRKRVGNGVCPCCQRTFKQLAAHMAHKHPEFKFPEHEAEA